MKKRFFIFAAAIGFSFTGVVSAADESAFAKANQAYTEARFQEAAEGYENLIQSGQWNATLFYDLGNAYYWLGHFGKAILNYEPAVAPEPQQTGTGADLRPAPDAER